MVSNRTKTLIRNTMWFAIGNFGSKLLSFLLVPLYTNILQTSEYGIADLITTTVNLLVPVLTLSVCDAVFRFAMDKDADRKEVFSEGILIVVFSSIMALFMYPVIKAVLPSVTPYWWYFWLLYAGNSLLGTLTMFLQATERTKIFAFQGIIQTFLFSVLNIFLMVLIKWGLCGYLISSIVACFTSNLYMVIRAKLYKDFSIKSIRKSTVVKMLKYSLPMIPASISWWVMTSIDRYMLLYMYNESYNGLYAVAHKIPSIITILTSFFIKAWQISAVKLKEDTDSTEYFSGLYNILMLLGITASFVLVFLSKIISKILFAKEFFTAWTMVPCLITAALFSTVALFMGAQFTAYKKSSLHLISNVIAMSANLMFNYIFIKLIGPVGVTLGTMLCFFVALAYRQIKVKQLINFKYDILEFSLNCGTLMLASIIMALDVPNWWIYDLLLFIIFLLANIKKYSVLILKFVNIRKTNIKGEK